MFVGMQLHSCRVAFRTVSSIIGKKHYKSAPDPITVAPSGLVLKHIGIVTAINKTRLLHVKRCKNKCSERFLVIFKLIMRQIKT